MGRCGSLFIMGKAQAPSPLGQTLSTLQALGLSALLKVSVQVPHSDVAR